MRGTTEVVAVLLALWGGGPWRGVVVVGMQVDLYAHKDKFGQSLNMDISEHECTNVARPWLNVTMSVDTHGSCMQFYDGKSCTGRIAVIQPFHTVHQMDLSLISFQNVIQSISPCGAKVPTGRYVIQSAVDASILTVSKHENQFAFAHTLPARAFIPKSQQWEIVEKATDEYDIQPRIHETNAPITYDSDAMKRGSFIRKVWKIESVGRGRYIIKSDWTNKCLYKTRFRQIEEHDCRAWSPNQEWVLRPLLTVPKPTPPKEPVINEDVKYQVPSRIVDEYLDERKLLREREEFDSSKSRYKIKNRRKKPVPSPAPFRARTQQVGPPKPEVYYSKKQPTFLKQGSFSKYSNPRAQMMYMEGMSPIYDEVKIEDPVFPDFLLHAVSRKEEEKKKEEDSAEDDQAEDDNKQDVDDDKYKPARYAVTRPPIRIPLPTGHPDFVRQKPKYDGRVKDPDFKREESVEEVEEEEEEEEFEEPEPQTEAQVQAAMIRDKEERNKKESEESEEDGGGEEDEEQDEEEVQDEQAAKESKENGEDSEEDPATSVAGFMKLLFKGINNKLNNDDKSQMEELNTFERKRR